MKEIEGLSEENGSVYYDHAGEKIDLTAIGDECGTMHMTKAIGILMEKTGLSRKDANALMYQAYRRTPPNREKLKKMADDVQKRREADKENSEKLKEDWHILREIREAKANAPVKCPKCGSANVTAAKKGFGAGKALVGAAAVGPAGLLAGAIGSHKIELTCLNCGHRFKA